jgi:hypothetical protein
MVDQVVDLDARAELPADVGAVVEAHSPSFVDI